MVGGCLGQVSVQQGESYFVLYILAKLTSKEPSLLPSLAPPSPDSSPSDSLLFSLLDFTTDDADIDVVVTVFSHQSHWIQALTMLSTTCAHIGPGTLRAWHFELRRPRAFLFLPQARPDATVASTILETGLSEPSMIVGADSRHCGPKRDTGVQQQHTMTNTTMRLSVG